MIQHLSAVDIQRVWRGWATRRQLLGSSWSGAPRLACTVQALLLEALYEALKHEREVYGTVCKDAPSLFAAVDRRGVGALSRDDLTAAFSRLDLGLSRSQVSDLISTIAAGGDSARPVVTAASLARWLRPGRIDIEVWMVRRYRSHQAPSRSRSRGSPQPSPARAEEGEPPLF